MQRVCVCGEVETLSEALGCQASPCICPPLWGVQEAMVPASGEGPDHIPCLGQYQTSRGNNATTTCQSPTAPCSEAWWPQISFTPPEGGVRGVLGPRMGWGLSSHSNDGHPCQLTGS